MLAHLRRGEVAARAHECRRPSFRSLGALVEGLKRVRLLGVIIRRVLARNLLLALGEVPAERDHIRMGGVEGTQQMLVRALEAGERLAPFALRGEDLCARGRCRGTR